jgi:hypothetical protein
VTQRINFSERIDEGNIPVKITMMSQIHTQKAMLCEKALQWAVGQIRSNEFWNESLRDESGTGFATNPKIHLQVQNDKGHWYGRTSLWAKFDDKVVEVFACPQRLQQAMIKALRTKKLIFEVLIDLNSQRMFVANIGPEITAMATIVHEWFIHAVEFIRTARKALESHARDTTIRIARRNALVSYAAIPIVNGQVKIKSPTGVYEGPDEREKREHNQWVKAYGQGSPQGQQRRAQEFLEKVYGVDNPRFNHDYAKFKHAFQHDLELMMRGTDAFGESPTPSDNYYWDDSSSSENHEDADAMKIALDKVEARVDAEAKRRFKAVHQKKPLERQNSERPANLDRKRSYSNRLSSDSDSEAESEGSEPDRYVWRDDIEPKTPPGGKKGPKKGGWFWNG